MATTSGTTIGVIRDAVVSAFRTEDELTEFVRIRLDLQLALVAGGENLGTVAFQLVEWLDGHGRLAELLDKALAAAPDNEQLKRARDQFLLTQKSADTVETGPPPDVSAERAVGPALWLQGADRSGAAQQDKVGERAGPAQAASVERWVTVGMSQVEALTAIQTELRTFVQAHIEALLLLRVCERAQQTVVDALPHPAQAKQMKFWLDWREQLDGLGPHVEALRRIGQFEVELGELAEALAAAGKAAEAGRKDARESGAAMLDAVDPLLVAMKRASENLVSRCHSEADTRLERLAAMIHEIQVRLDLAQEGQSKMDQKPLAPAVQKGA
jgi:hypothetical protein